jgi:hypothetical protein
MCAANVSHHALKVDCLVGVKNKKNKILSLQLRIELKVVQGVLGSEDVPYFRISTSYIWGDCDLPILKSSTRMKLGERPHVLIQRFA